MSDREVVLSRTLRETLVALNPGLPADAYDDAVRQIVTTVAVQTLPAINRKKYALLKDGVQVTFRNSCRLGADALKGMWYVRCH